MRILKYLKKRKREYSFTIFLFISFTFAIITSFTGCWESSESKYKIYIYKSSDMEAYIYYYKDSTTNLYGPGEESWPSDAPYFTWIRV